MSEKFDATGYIGPSIAEVRAKDARGEYNPLHEHHGTETVETRPRMSGQASQALAAREIQGVFGLVLTEIRRAVAKHGYNRTPLSTGMAVSEKIVVLGEEFGEVCRAATYDEVCRAATYDEGDPTALRDEAIQLATMAMALAASLS